MGALREIWSGHKHYLDKMSLGDLTVAYFRYPAIQAYLVLAGVAAYVASRSVVTSWNEHGLPLGLAVLAGFLVYPPVWYLLHRFMLHGRFLYRSARTASLWKRIHYDHHQDPTDLRVLFGAMYTTLPTIAVVTLPIGFLIGGTAGAAGAMGAALVSTLFYEFCHCIQHLHYTPRNRFLRRIKQLHLLHHYHNETGNYGITNFFWDRMIGTYYGSAGDVPRSATVFNLGYAEEECARYPWVARISESTQKRS